MKKLLIMLCVLGMAAGASAQKVGRVPVYRYTRPQVVMGMGAYAPFYPYYGFGYSPFFHPFYPYNRAFGYPQRPTELDLKIEDIRNDYQDRIWSARRDKSLSRKERRQKVHEIKSERNKAITQAKREYYKS